MMIYAIFTWTHAADHLNVPISVEEPRGTKHDPPPYRVWYHFSTQAIGRRALLFKAPTNG
ncbi:unnamed protein product [Fusarium graminearum]|uniref:Chromosome 4, complete genome n=2 Tax=Gibberella zeae TaxID=5518 RepID=A0A098DN57_GIBZE|nr:unnamed protein product [Fusarium graminearum]CAF3531252.1 unnamed protein product [Fusarium graminearum]CAG1983607.1 unnamed protein product [Fusarium graminearum]CAG1991240.1 unnamed protein product [Fusarium graminearum]CAG1991861.1 unnamed protein product [Fusarium graminearum]